MITTTFDTLYCRIRDLSEKINELHNVNPKVYLKFGKNTENPAGSCAATYKKVDMYIEIILPQNFKTSAKNKTLVDVMLCHEYCHYLEALTQSASDRKASIDLYNNDRVERTRDEKKTWRKTRALAKCLGLWNRKFYNAIKDCYYASDLQY